MCNSCCDPGCCDDTLCDRINKYQNRNCYSPYQCNTGCGSYGCSCTSNCYYGNPSQYQCNTGCGSCSSTYPCQTNNCYGYPSQYGNCYTNNLTTYTICKCKKKKCACKKHKKH